MKWKLGKIETITLPDTETKCTSSAQEKETEKPYTHKQKTNQPTRQQKKLTLPVVAPESRVDLTSILCKEHAIGGILDVWHS